MCYIHSQKEMGGRVVSVFVCVYLSAVSTGALHYLTWECTHREILWTNLPYSHISYLSDISSKGRRLKYKLCVWSFSDLLLTCSIDSTSSNLLSNCQSLSHISLLTKCLPLCCGMELGQRYVYQDLLCNAMDCRRTPVSIIYKAITL